MNRRSSAQPMNSQDPMSNDEIMTALRQRRAERAAQSGYDVRRLYGDITTRIDRSNVRWADIAPVHPRVKDAPGEL
jgi:hypothetical protein